MPSLNRNEKVKCEDCGKEYRRDHAARHHKSCARGVISCPECNYCTYNQQEMKLHTSKKHVKSNPKSTKCVSCEKEFPSYYSLQQHRKKDHGMKARKTNDSVADLNKILENEEDSDQLRDELNACQHFLTDTEMENGRHKVFNFQLSKLDPNLVNEKLNQVFEKLDCAAKINIALGFVLRNIETSEYRYFYAHENNTLFDKSILLCTKADLTTIQNKVNEQDIIEICTQERQNTKWRFKLITNVTIFAALLKNVPMGCPDSVIPEPLLRNNHVNCLISNQDTKQPYNDNLCLFRALAVHLHGTTILETSTSKIFNDFLEKSGCDPKQFRGVSMDNLPVVEDVVEKNIFIYDINIEDGDFVGELARRSIGKYENTVKLLRYNNHIIYVNNIDNFFKCFRCPTCDTFFHKADHFNKHLLRCKDRIKNIYPKNVYTLRETLFEKLDGFNIEYTKEQTLFKNVAIFDFESICVPSEELKPTETITWIGKHEPISVSISSNLLDKPIFLCDKGPQSLIIDFVANLELLAEKK